MKKTFAAFIIMLFATVTQIVWAENPELYDTSVIINDDTTTVTTTVLQQDGYYIMKVWASVLEYYPGYISGQIVAESELLYMSGFETITMDTKSVAIGTYYIIVTIGTQDTFYAADIDYDRPTHSFGIEPEPEPDPDPSPEVCNPSIWTGSSSELGAICMSACGDYLMADESYDSAEYYIEQANEKCDSLGADASYCMICSGYLDPAIPDYPNPAIPGGSNPAPDTETDDANIGDAASALVGCFIDSTI